MSEISGGALELGRSDSSRCTWELRKFQGKWLALWRGRSKCYVLTQGKAPSELTVSAETDGSKLEGHFAKRVTWMLWKGATES